VREACVRYLIDELSACEARHQQHLKQAEEKYVRNLTALQKLVDNKTQEVRQWASLYAIVFLIVIS
jgi:hypothetical protein